MMLRKRFSGTTVEISIFPWIFQGINSKNGSTNYSTAKIICLKNIKVIVPEKRIFFWTRYHISCF